MDAGGRPSVDRSSQVGQRHDGRLGRDAALDAGLDPGDHRRIDAFTTRDLHALDAFQEQIPDAELAVPNLRNVARLTAR